MPVTGGWDWSSSLSRAMKGQTMAEYHGRDVPRNILEDAGYDNVSLRSDPFHANIEEESVPFRPLIRQLCKKRIRHDNHFADNNRLPPGTRVRSISKPLASKPDRDRLSRFIGLECMPIKPEPNMALEKGINYLRGIEDAMKVVERGRGSCSGPSSATTGPRPGWKLTRPGA